MSGGYQQFDVATGITEVNNPYPQLITFDIARENGFLHLKSHAAAFSNTQSPMIVLQNGIIGGSYNMLVLFPTTGLLGTNTKLIVEGC